MASVDQAHIRLYRHHSGSVSALKQFSLILLPGGGWLAGCSIGSAVIGCWLGLSPLMTGLLYPIIIFCSLFLFIGFGMKPFIQFYGWLSPSPVEVVLTPITLQIGSRKWHWADLMEISGDDRTLQLIHRSGETTDLSWSNLPAKNLAWLADHLQTSLKQQRPGTPTDIPAALTTLRERS